MYTQRIPAGVVVDLADEDEHWTEGLLEGLTRLPPGEAGVLSGEPGTGKTTSGLTAFPDVRYLALEVSGVLAAAYCQRLGVRHGGIYDRSHLATATDRPLEHRLGLDEIPGGYLLVDSLGVFEFEALEAFQAIMSWCRRTGGRALVIQHATKDGRVAGAQKVLHAGEVTIWLSHRRDGLIQARTLKSRWAPTRSRTFALDAGRPSSTAGRFVSVEGPVGGPYELAPWPTAPGVRAPSWAGGWAAAERIARKLRRAVHQLEPPAACACAESALYAGGLVDAPDVDQRARFAEEHGIPFHHAAELAELLSAPPEDHP